MTDNSRDAYAGRLAAIRAILADPVWSGWSDRAIAEQIGTSRRSVGRARQKAGLPPCVTRLCSRLGVTYAIDVSYAIERRLPLPS